MVEYAHSQLIDRYVVHVCVLHDQFLDSFICFQEAKRDVVAVIRMVVSVLRYVFMTDIHVLHS